MTATTPTKAETFVISVPDAVLKDLGKRLAQTRWPDQEDGVGWEQGADIEYLKGLVAYWQDGFDWRVQEAALNGFPQVMVDVEGTKVHAIHARGKGPNPFPIMLLHGWPDSFWRMTKIVPLLADPGAHGGDPADAFDVVVPSIPGFGFSERPTVKTDRAWTTARMAGLMAALGYERYGVHGGDVGSGLTEWLGHTHPEAVAGIHMTDVPYWHLFTDVPDDLSEAEQAFMAAGQEWSMTEGAYAMLQSTRPQSAAVGLNDSPAGLAAWIVEKFRAWSDCDGDIETRFRRTICSPT